MRKVWKTAKPLPGLMLMLAMAFSPEQNAALICEEARRVGFHRVGLARAAPYENYEIFRRWLAAGYHGSMDYLARDPLLRQDPRAILPTAQTVVSVALAYEPAGFTENSSMVMAGYVLTADYHTYMRARLDRLAAGIAHRLGRPIAARACVDSAPLLERQAAVAAGIGFIGKNNMLVVPGLGSYVLLGELLIDLIATPSAPLRPRCGACRACIDACPSKALVAPYTLDARRCVSYLTLGHSGEIPLELRGFIGKNLFGCDRCQKACPYNVSAAAHLPADPPPLRTLPALAEFSLGELLNMGAQRLRKAARGSIISRISRMKMVRNAVVVAGNSGGVSELPALTELLADPHPIISEHAAWAIAEIRRRQANQ